MAAADPQTQGPSIGIEVPDDDEFQGVPYLDAPELTALTRKLLESTEEFEHIAFLTIACLWRRNGGKSGGAPQFMRLSRPTEENRYFANADFVIAVSADHLRDSSLTARQFEAMLFDQAAHVGLNNQGQPMRRRDDFQGMYTTLKHYGADAIHPRLRGAVLATTQLRLLPEPDEAETDGATDGAAGEASEGGEG